MYNKALALASLHDENSSKQAVHLLCRLAGLSNVVGSPALETPYCDIATTLSHRSKVELSLYALGAQANVLVAARDRQPTRVGLGADVPEEHIARLLDHVEHLCAQEKEQHWRSLQTTRAVVLTAHAHV